MRKLFVAIPILLLLIGGATVSSAQETPTAEDSPTANQPNFCSGGALIGFQSNIQNAEQTINVGQFLPVPNGGTMNFIGPAIVTVTLTGEAFMTGVSGADTIVVELMIDGVLVPPTQPIGFHTGAAQAAHSATWCQRVGSGTHKAEVKATVLDGAPTGTPTGRLDDFVVRLDRNNP